MGGPVTSIPASCGKYCNLTILPILLQSSHLLQYLQYLHSSHMLYHLLVLHHMITTMYLYLMLFMNNIILLLQQYYNCWSLRLYQWPYASLRGVCALALTLLQLHSFLRNWHQRLKYRNIEPSYFMTMSARLLQHLGVFTPSSTMVSYVFYTTLHHFAI